MAVMGVGGFGDYESSNKEEALSVEVEGGEGVGERNYMTEVSYTTSLHMDLLLLQ